MINTLKAEFYKQYSKRSSYIIPIIFLVVTAIAIYNITNSAIVSTWYDVTSPSDILTVMISSLTLFVISLVGFTLVPIIMGIGVFSQDYKNNVIASTIASGATRTNIFYAKILVAISQSLLYWITIVVGSYIGFILVSLKFDQQLAELVNEFIDDIDFSFFFGTDGVTMILNTLVTLLSYISVAALSIVLTRNFVGAFFTTIGFNLALSIIKFIIIYTLVLSNIPLYYTTDYATNAYNTASIVLTFISSIIFILLAWLKFYKSEY